MLHITRGHLTDSHLTAPSAALIPAMIAPPSVTETNELRKPVAKNRRRIQARARSSNAIAASASSTADRYWGMRNGSVCRTPPRKVPAPVIAPRWNGPPRPVRSPGVREPFGEGHADPGADRGGQPGEERVARLVRGERDGEDRGERRQRAVDQAGHRRLRPLEQERPLVALPARACYGAHASCPPGQRGGRGSR